MKKKILAVLTALVLTGCGGTTQFYQQPQAGQAYAVLKESNISGNSFTINSIDNHPVQATSVNGATFKIAPGVHAIEVKAEQINLPVDVTSAKNIVIIATITKGHQYTITGNIANGHVQIWLAENGKRVSQVYSQ